MKKVGKGLLAIGLLSACSVLGVKLFNKISEKKDVKLSEEIDEKDELNGSDESKNIHFNDEN